ncbi:MAG: hypothetical protein E7566_01650 [Ruminococcaceae bacterium]|nr:hypothetical protein [Oscillospiraceae bacterium]
MVKARSAKVPTMKTLLNKARSKGDGSGKFIALSFIVPFVLLAIAFALENVAPFGILKTGVNYILYQFSDFLGMDVYVEQENPWGTQQMHVVDMWHQYFPFLVELHDKLQSGGSLFWTWSVGMGVNFIAMGSYYLFSPLNFLSAFFSTDVLSSYIVVATVIKLSLAGMFTAICFKIIFKKTSLATVFFSTMFALCSFNMGYYWNIIWLDSVAMLPLVVAGTICLLRDGKYKLFIISLALSVIFNYYIGLFICVAVFLTAIGYTVSCWVSLKKAAKDLLRTAISALISLMLTAIVTIPAYLGLQNCYKQTTGMPKGFDINIGADNTSGVLDAFHKIFSNALSFISPTSTEGMPNIGCGLLCLVLLGIFFCSKKIKKGEKIFCISTLMLFVISFIFRRLDFMWHGFHYPNMLPYRFSFLFSFLIIYMGYRAYLVLKDSSYIDVIITTLVFSMFILLYYFRKYIVVEEGVTNRSPYNENIFVACIIIGAFMIAAILLYVLKLVPKRFLSVFLCLLVIGEMSATAIIGVDTVGSTSMLGYPTEKANVDILLSRIEERTKNEAPDIYRIEANNAYTLNDGAIYDYNGLSMFNSMANATFNRFFGDMGGAGYLGGNRYTYYDSSPVTNVLFNIRYLYAKSSKSYGEPFMKVIDSAGNVTLYENTYYINMGFLANEELRNFELPMVNDKNKQLDANADPADAYVNPFENQIDFWKKATGIEEPLYTPIEKTSTEHNVDPSMKYSDGMEIGYTTSGTTKVKYNFQVPKEGYVYSFFYISGPNGKGKISINNSQLREINIEQPHIAAIGKVNEGDTVSMQGELKRSSWIRAHLYYLNEDVYRRGIEILKQSTLDTTHVSDTELEGTINANRDGILYTSIPYEKGWTVKVDGVEQEVIPLGVVYPDADTPDNRETARLGGMCCVAITKGTHTIEFSYTPAGFKFAAVIFAAAFIVLLFFAVCTSRFMRNKKIAKPVIWLFDPSVKERASDASYDFIRVETPTEAEPQFFDLDTFEDIETTEEELNIPDISEDDIFAGNSESEETSSKEN